MELKEFDTPFYRMPGFYVALGITVLLAVVSWLTQEHRDLFVCESGKFKVVGSLTVMLSVLMLFKTKWAKKGLVVFVAISTLASVLFTFMVVHEELRWPLVFLSLTMVAILAALVFSKSLKSYLTK